MVKDFVTFEFADKDIMKHKILPVDTWDVPTVIKEAEKLDQPVCFRFSTKELTGNRVSIINMSGKYYINGVVMYVDDEDLDPLVKEGMVQQGQDKVFRHVSGTYYIMTPEDTVAQEKIQI